MYHPCKAVQIAAQTYLTTLSLLSNSYQDYQTRRYHNSPGNVRRNLAIVTTSQGDSFDLYRQRKKLVREVTAILCYFSLQRSVIRWAAGDRESAASEERLLRLTFIFLGPLDLC